MSTVSIRRAGADDAEPLAAVYRSAYRENRRLGFPAKAESATPETVGEWIAEHEVHVATVDAEVVGGVRLEEVAPERVKLGRLAVRADCKGDGIGSRLLEHAECVARNHGYATVRLTTPEDHPYLPGFYRSHGYETTGKYPLEYREYDEVVMEKRVV